MSLQVWLPFTDGTLKQQGLKNVEAVIGGNVGLNDNGKLGKCATISASGSGITLPASSMTSFIECTVAFWIKINSWNTSYATFFQAGLSSTAWNNYIFGILRNNTGSNLCFTLTNSSGTSSSATYTTSNLNTAQWYHLAFTYKDGTICIYIDGVLDKTYSTTYVPNFAGITNISIGRGTNNSSYQTNCNLNDFRLYDHCLSPMEVKELSKGLVLHYPLNRQGWGQENLLKGTDTLEITNNINTGVGGWDNISSLITTTDGIKLSGRSGAPCIGLPLATVGSINNNEDYTLSFKYRTNKAIGMNFYYIESSGSNISVYNSEATEISTTEWKDYKWTINNSTVADRNPRAILLFYAFSSSSSDWVEIKRDSIKLEKGSITTPWCPNSSDALATIMGLNSTTEYDYSGFCNNGMRTGTFTWTSDTPKYSVSTSAQGSSGAKIIGPGMPTEARSAAIWVKCAKTVNSVFFADKNSTLECGLLNSLIYANTINSAGFTTTHWKDNQWNHVVVVNDNGTRRVYVNGESETANGANNYYMHTTDAVYLWTRSDNNSYPFNGQMSDFRVYATALSADDVKSLYQNSAYIDSSGNVYGAVHEEV